MYASGTSGCGLRGAIFSFEAQKRESDKGETVTLIKCGIAATRNAMGQSAQVCNEIRCMLLYAFHGKSCSFGLGQCSVHEQKSDKACSTVTRMWTGITYGYTEVARRGSTTRWSGEWHCRRGQAGPASSRLDRGAVHLVARARMTSPQRRAGSTTLPPRSCRATPRRSGRKAGGPAQGPGAQPPVRARRKGQRWRKWLAHSPPTKGILGGFVPGFSHVGVVLNDAACRRVLSGYSRSPALAFQRRSILGESVQNSSFDVLVHIHQIHQIFRPAEPMDKPVQPKSTKRLIFERPVYIGWWMHQLAFSRRSLESVGQPGISAP
ncbi:hypothetical protein PR048_004696 [Dryococelus australis]|uniref:Uncharacterized protein n=1 Tax=Dryococelus australis TaxID=614101 RepID=A0ABQ9I6X7_9NEOP|nr:hypothetical protein PR048_004696 [Dryococelus australis]